MVWLKLIICIIVVLFSGRMVAKYGDIIAERTGIGRVWMGVIVISVITSLPELFTGISAVTLVDAPDLTVGNLIGANAFNLFNLALLDIFHRGGSILATASPVHRLTGWFGLILAALVGVFIFISSKYYDFSLGWIGWYTPVILLFYLFSARQIFLHEKQHPGPGGIGVYPEEVPLKKVYIYFGIAAAFIIGAGVWLAAIGDELAAATGWGQGFVGNIFLAFTTTLPEITVSFTAVRIGAIDMAVANMVGSNLFNMAIIGILDIIDSNGPVLAAVSEAHLVSIVIVVAMVAIFIAASRFRPERFLRLSWFNISLIVLFLANAYLSFFMA